MLVLCLTGQQSLMFNFRRNGEEYIVSLKNGDLTTAQCQKGKFIREGKDVTDDVVGFTLKSNFGVSIGLGEPIKYNLK